MTAFDQVGLYLAAGFAIALALGWPKHCLDHNFLIVALWPLVAFWLIAGVVLLFVEDDWEDRLANWQYDRADRKWRNRRISQ